MLTLSRWFTTFQAFHFIFIFSSVIAMQGIRQACHS